MKVEMEVKVYQVSYTCDECTIGEMKFTGMAKMCNPPLNEHKCTHCGLKKDFRGIKYHTIEYK